MPVYRCRNQACKKELKVEAPRRPIWLSLDDTRRPMKIIYVRCPSCGTKNCFEVPTR
jgi:DNA-directed RNA polymerase subunit RPC12/RpoP